MSGNAQAPFVIVCEPQCWGLEHAHFNASVLDTALLAYPDARIAFLGETTHLQFVRDVLEQYDRESSSRVEWTPLDIPPRSLVGWRRFAREFGWLRRVFGELRGQRADAVMLCSITSPGIVALKAQLLAARRRVPVFAIMHSVLQTIFDRQSLRPSTWIINLRHAMALPHPQALRFVTLGAHINENLKAQLPSLAGHFVSIEMPYLMHELPPLPPGDPRHGATTRFGFFGVGNTVKRFDLFARIAKDVTARVPGARMEFTIVGYLPDGPGAINASAVTNVRSDAMTKDEYRRRARDTTYVLSTADPAHYRMLGSATFLDALAFGKPGIFLRSAYLEHYFEKMGDIGHLCDSVEAMADLVAAIARDFPEERYRQQCRNIERGRAHFTPPQLAPRLREITDAARVA